MTRYRIKFICPRCGEDRIEEVGTAIISMVIGKIEEDGSVEYETEDQVEGYLGTERFVCAGCGYTLQHPKVGTIKHTDTLFEYLQNNGWIEEITGGQNAKTT